MYNVLYLAMLVLDSYFGQTRAGKRSVIFAFAAHQGIDVVVAKLLSFGDRFSKPLQVAYGNSGSCIA